MRFIGSKSLLVESIEKVLDENIVDEASSFCDIFSGTASVGRYFKRKYEVISNDIMYFSYVLQMATIKNNEMPKFEGLKQIEINDPLDYLENTDLKGIDFDDKKYFISNNYAPTDQCNRMYLTQQNANRIDFIRLKIEEWKEKRQIEENEYFYLLACLIESVPYVSNISGTYGAYLKKWDKRSLNVMKLERLDIVNNNKKNMSYNINANNLIKKIEGDILYLDPPYNSRQYVPNYHVLETLALYDYPEIKGVTGLRNYSDKKSKYCVKKEVHNEFESLIKYAKFKHILVSYSTDGLMTIEEIEKILKRYGKDDTYKLYKIPYRKYKSKHKQDDDTLYELIFYIQKEVKRENCITNCYVENYSIHKYKDKSKKKKYLKSPLNYIGGKYKILNQIMPYFPKDIDTFIELFAGGLNVGINVDAKKIIANDYNNFIIDIYKEFKKNTIEETISHIEQRIDQFKLSKDNEEGFKEFRNFYNSNQNALDLYTLVCYSFNYQFRFNNNLEYNNPFGRNRSQFSGTLKEKLIIFIKALKEKNIDLTCRDFIALNKLEITSNDFVYCDPPYLITTGSYNDGNRGFKSWGEEQEKKLLEYLDYVNSKNVKFALSNVLEHKGKCNTILKDWAQKYKLIYLNNDYSNSSYNTSNEKGHSVEVLIINY